jgi:hypothetical protein
MTRINENENENNVFKKIIFFSKNQWVTPF